MARRQSKIIERAQEPSTHAGVAVAAQIVGAAFPQYAALAQAVSGLCAALAVALPERGK